MKPAAGSRWWLPKMWAYGVILGVWLVSRGLAGDAPAPPPAAAAAALPAPPDALWAQAEKSFLQGHYQAAEDLFVRFATQFPGDRRRDEARVRQGCCRMKLGQAAQAVKLWRQVLAEPGGGDRQARAAAWEQLYAYQLAHGRRGERERLLASLRAEQPGAEVTVRLHGQEAQAAFRKGDFAAAAACWQWVRAGLPADEQRLRRSAELALSLDSSAPQLLLRDAQALLDSAQPEYALPLCDLLARRGGAEQRAAEICKGRALAALRRYPEAIACWDKALRPSPRAPGGDEALLLLGRTWAYSLNQAEKGLDAYRRLLREWPCSALVEEARYQLAGVYYAAQDYPQARQCFVELARDYPRGKYASFARDYAAQCERALKAAAEAARQQAAQEAGGEGALRRVEQLQQQRQFAEAVRLLKQLRATPPVRRPDEILFRLGQCQAALGALEAAQAAYRDLTRAFPESARAPDALWALARLQLDNDMDVAAARASCEALLRGYPASPRVAEAEKTLGMICLCQEQKAEAQAIFTRLAAKRVVDTNAPPDSLTRLLRACERPQPPSGALLWREAQAQSLLRLAEVRWTAAEFAEALTTFVKAAQVAAGTETGAYAQLQAGRCHNQLRQYEQALDCYAFFQERYRQSAWADDALLRAGVICVGPLHDQRRGRRFFEAILQRYPNGNKAEKALLHLATLALWGGDWREALARHEEFLRRYPNSPYAPFVRIQRLPEIQRALKGAKT